MSVSSLLEAARFAVDSGDISTAVTLCNQALAANPLCVDALLVLGSLSASRGMVSEAERFLKEAARIDPTCYDAARWLGTLLIGRNGGDEAVCFAETAVRLRPEYAEAHVVLGLAAMGMGDYSLAITGFLRAVEIEPTLAGAHHNLGVVYQREERYRDAIVEFKRAAKLSPATVETHLQLASCYLAEDQGDEAMSSSTRALELNPKSTVAKRLYSDARFMAFHGENGLRHIQGAIVNDPQSAFAYAMMGSRMQEQGDFPGAEEQLRNSISLEPNQGFAYYVLAHNRKLNEADRSLTQKMENVSCGSSLIFEDRQYINYALGKAYDDLGEYEKAIQHFDLAHVSGLVGNRQASKDGPDSVVHPAARMFSKDTFHLFEDLGLDTEEPIFIIGMPRSGTTLLEQIVSRHSHVGAAGELFFWRNNCRRVLDVRRGALNPAELQRTGRRYLELIRSIAPGMGRVTDKFPSNYAYLGLLSLIYPKAVFLHARRHPLDVCLSIYMRPFTTNQGLGRTRDEIVDSFQVYWKTMRHWREVLGSDRFLDVDYESLVHAPDEASRRVIDWCGLEWEDACLHPDEGERRVETFSKWQVRQPVYTTSVDRWRNYEPWLGEFQDLLEYEPA